jgi:hypothetical protein
LNCPEVKVEDDGTLRIKDDHGGKVRFTLAEYKEVSATIRSLMLDQIKQLGGLSKDTPVDLKALEAIKQRALGQSRKA